MNLFRGASGKVCDRISDMVVDSTCQEILFRVACETLTTTNKAFWLEERGQK